MANACAQSAQAVTAFQDGDQSTLTSLIGESAHVASKPGVEAHRHFRTVPRHCWVFVLACIEACRDKHKRFFWLCIRFLKEAGGGREEGITVGWVKGVVEVPQVCIRLKVHVRYVLSPSTTGYIY